MEALIAPPKQEIKDRDQARVDRIVELGKQHNVCNIKPDPVGGVICNGGRGCCHGCKHLSKNGCTVSAHGCRMWFCKTAWDLFPLEAKKEINELIKAYESPIYFRHDGFEVIMPRFSCADPLRMIF